MKKLFIFSIVVLSAKNLPAQTWAEWFRQKATQKKYLLQQIGALKIYSGYVSRGYTIAKEGLNSIQSIKNGDLLQHTQYFTSLSAVSPTIQRSAKVANIIVLQINIAKQSGNVLKTFRNNHHFTATEITYLHSVFSKLLADCTNNLEELSSIITNKTLQMKDDERMEAIDKIYLDLQDKQEFIRAFSNTAAGLSIQRSNDENEIIIAKKINGLK